MSQPPWYTTSNTTSTNRHWIFIFCCYSVMLYLGYYLFTIFSPRKYNNLTSFNAFHCDLNWKAHKFLLLKPIFFQPNLNIVLTFVFSWQIMARIFTHEFHSLLSTLQNGLRNVISWRNLFSKDEMGNSILGVDNNNNSFQLIYLVFLFFISFWFILAILSVNMNLSGSSEINRHFIYFGRLK